MQLIPYSYTFTATNSASTTKNVECTKGTLRWVTVRNTGTSAVAPVYIRVYLEDRRHPNIPLIPLISGYVRIPQGLGTEYTGVTIAGLGRFPNLPVTNRHRLTIIVDNDVGSNQTIALEWGIEN